MNKEQLDVLNYIGSLTWHVLDGHTSAPAKIPSKYIIKKYQQKYPKIIEILTYLYKSRYITKFSFSSQKKGIRITSLGCHGCPFYNRENKKRYLFWNENGDPYLMDHEDWVKIFSKILNEDNKK